MRTMLALRTALPLGALLAPFLLVPSTSQAQDPYRWCAYYAGKNGGGTNCYFLTYRQCMEALSGNGGYCGPNPLYGGGPPPARHRYYAPRN